MEQKDRDKLTEKFRDKKWILYGHKSNELFIHIYPHPSLLSMCGDGDIYKLELSLCKIQILEEDLDYYGWINLEKLNGPSMIYPSICQVNMCFISGYEVCEDLGEGVVVRLDINDLGIGE